MVHAAVAACLVLLFTADAVGGREASSLENVAARTTIFHDDVGEDPDGPDITTVTVSSEVDRVLTFHVAIPTHPKLTDDMRLRIWLDADDDPTTGLSLDGLAGLDHFLLVDRWELGFGAAGLFRCSGSTCGGGVELGRSAALRLSYERGATLDLNVVGLGIPALGRFRFSVETMDDVAFDPVERRYDFTRAHRDHAPAQGALWTYEPRLLLVTRFTARPARPSAGKPFALGLRALRSDTGAVLATGKVACSLRIAGRSGRARSRRFERKQAVCGFEIPANARGKRFRSSISILLGGEKVARSLAGRVR